MSVDINWQTLTSGPDGQELAETIRDFVHDRFQQVEFPKLIRSVKVHTFDFGTTAPEIVLKDVCEPLADFYETEDDDDDNADTEPEVPNISNMNRVPNTAARHVRQKGDPRRPSELNLYEQPPSAGLARGGILGGASNLGYFNLPAFPGTSTPLAAVTGAHFQNGGQQLNNSHHHSASFGSISPSSASPPTRPMSRDHSYFDSRAASATLDGSIGRPPTNEKQASIERSPEDLQVVFHVTYSGNVRLSMTAEVHLDYPMPNFVAIPLKLNITGLTFNGVGILAYIKKRAHLSFLSPEDAEALVGSEYATGSPDSPTQPSRVGGLLEEIKIESEMGETGEGKQVLKNVGKIEKFVLEQVQRIFEEEFVYPSFWTFLV